jgi:hypothetical protein
MEWAGRAAFVEEKRGSYRVLVGKSYERGHSEDIGVDGKVILKWILKFGL